MHVPFMKTIAGVAMVAAVAAATPAMAGGYYGGGGYYHGGGYYGGGWGGGGWVGPAVGLGVLGLATGAIIASQYPPAYYAPPPGNCWQRRPVYDQWGRFIGRQTVNVCQ